MSLDRGYQDDCAGRLLITSRKVSKSLEYAFWTDYEDKTNGAIASVFSGAIMLKMTVFGPGVRSPAYGQGGMVKVDDDSVVLVTAKHNHVSDDKATFSQAVAEFKGPQTYLTNLKEIQIEAVAAVDCSSGAGGEYTWRYGMDVSLAQFEIKPPRIPPWESSTFHVFELVPNDFHYVSQSLW